MSYAFFARTEHFYTRALPRVFSRVRERDCCVNCHSGRVMPTCALDPVQGLRAMVKGAGVVLWYSLSFTLVINDFARVAKANLVYVFYKEFNYFTKLKNIKNLSYFFEEFELIDE